MGEITFEETVKAKALNKASSIVTMAIDTVVTEGFTIDQNNTADDEADRLLMAVVAKLKE